jgi:hypothetical protein
MEEHGRETAGALKTPRRYCAPESLAYAAASWKRRVSAPLLFDETYRVAQLALVAPQHPAVLSHLPSLDYESGRYRRTRYSLILPIGRDVLEQAPVFQALERDLSLQTFASKVAWELLERRAARLHVTLAGGLEKSALEGLALTVSGLLRTLGPLHYRLGGPFVGSKNQGRIYFTAYPEQGPQGNVFSVLQRSIGCPETRLYLLGYYNLRDELTASEAAELHAFLMRWADVTVAELVAPSLVILGTQDDLALDSEIVAHVSASAA